MALLLIYSFCLLSLLGLGFRASLSKSVGMAEATQKYEHSASVMQDHLSQIEQAEVTTDFVRLLDLTGALYPPEVREKTSAKIRTHPDWQQELLRLLETDNALYAFSFLASNDVDNSDLFLEPVRLGAMHAATWIRSTIQVALPSEFEPDMFSEEVTSVLSTIDKFDGKGVDYLPAVQQMRSAVDETVAGKKINFNCSAVLDKWILAHS